MTEKKARDRNRDTWTNLRQYELSYRHGNDTIPQTRYFQCETVEDAFNAFFKSFHGKTDGLAVVSMTVENPYTHTPELVDVQEILTNNHKYSDIGLTPDI